MFPFYLSSTHLCTIKLGYLFFMEFKSEHTREYKISCCHLGRKLFTVISYLCNSVLLKWENVKMPKNKLT